MRARTKVIMKTREEKKRRDKEENMEMGKTINIKQVDKGSSESLSRSKGMRSYRQSKSTVDS